MTKRELEVVNALKMEVQTLKRENSALRVDVSFQKARVQAMRRAQGIRPVTIEDCRVVVEC